MLTIRTMRESDLAGVAGLEAQIFPDAWSCQALRDSYNQKQTLLLVAYNDRQLIGYLILYYVLEEGEIARIAVEPGHRRQGVGAKMLLELENLCEDNGITKLMLDVREHNETAVAFYKDYGFREDGLRKDYYTNPTEHAVLMSRRLGR